MTEQQEAAMLAVCTGAYEDKVPTVVVFRKLRKKYGDCVVAMLMSLNAGSGDANPGHVVDYVHVGQHGECEPYHTMRISRAATPQEYADLKEELESMNYVLTVRRRMNLRWHIKRARRVKERVKILRAA